MKTYLSFINENLFTDFLKKSFENTIKVLVNDNQTNLINYINRINNIKTFKDSVQIINELFKFNLNLKSNNIKELKSNILTDLISVDVGLKTLSKKFGINELLPKEFFSDTNNNYLKKIFIYDNEQLFMKNIYLNINILMKNLMKKSNYTDEQIEKLLNKVNELQEIEHLQNTDKLDTMIQNDNDTTNNNNQNDNDKKENNNQFQLLIKNYHDFQKNILYNLVIKKLNEYNKKRENQDPLKF